MWIFKVVGWLCNMNLWRYLVGALYIVTKNLVIKHLYITLIWLIYSFNTSSHASCEWCVYTLHHVCTLKSFMQNQYLISCTYFKASAHCFIGIFLCSHFAMWYCSHNIKKLKTTIMYMIEHIASVPYGHTRGSFEKIVYWNI